MAIKCYIMWYHKKAPQLNIINKTNPKFFLGVGTVISVPSKMQNSVGQILASF